MIKYISPVNILFVSNTSSRRLQRNNFLSSKTFSRRLARCLQDVFKTYLQDDFKTSWKTKKCYAEDVLKTSSRHVLKTSGRRLEDQQMFAGLFTRSVSVGTLYLMSRNVDFRTSMLQLSNLA